MKLLAGRMKVDDISGNRWHFYAAHACALHASRWAGRDRGRMATWFYSNSWLDREELGATRGINELQRWFPGSGTMVK